MENALTHKQIFRKMIHNVRNMMDLSTEQLDYIPMLSVNELQELTITMNSVIKYMLVFLNTI